MRIKITSKPLPPQLDFLKDQHHFLGMFGGYGSGKTHGVVLKMFQLMDRNRGLAGGLLVPNTKMFRRDVFPEIKNVCADSGIEFEYRKSDGELYFPTTKSTVYIFHGEDDGESIRGPNLAWGVINEMTLLSWETFKAFIARIRLKNAPFPQVAGSGTPEDFNWAFDYFIDKPGPDVGVVYADSRKNIHVAKGYIQALLSSYDDIAAEIYVGGKFMAKTGERWLYKFDRNLHVVEKAPIMGVEGRIEEWWVHCDFNVFPMAATLYRYIPELSIPLWGVDEINIHGGDTEELCKIIADKIGHGWRKAKIYPDAMGGRQKHSASKGGRTDLGIMEEYGFEDLRYKNAYSVRDQMNAANAFIGKGKVRWLKDKCPETIRDLERVKKKHGTHEMDKSDPMRTHWLDGLKNMLHFEFPAIGPHNEVTSRRIR